MTEHSKRRALKFRLRITMESDWHIGTGNRGPGVDRAIARDHDGLPFIPATTLRGIWRDAGEMLAYALDDGRIYDVGTPERPRSWQGALDHLFGSQPTIEAGLSRETVGQHDPGSVRRPIPSAITLYDARFSPAVISKLVGPEPTRTAMRDALAFIKPGVAIDERSGRAKDEHLRFEEVACGGAELVADGHVECSDGSQDAVCAFLLAAVGFVERLGGKRRRGLGRCRIVLEFPEDDRRNWSTAVVAKMLDNIKTPPDLGGSQIADNLLDGIDEWRQKQRPDFFRICLRLELLSPLIIPRDVLGNVITSRDFIPGSLLLGPVAEILGTLKIGNLGARIANGDIRVLAATPEIEGRRGLPIPLNWHVLKEAGRQPDDSSPRQFSVLLEFPDEKPENSSSAGPIRQKKQIRAGYAVQFDGRIFYRSGVAHVIRTHNTIQDDIQTPTENIGGVFSYEAIAERQVLRSELWLATDLAERVEGINAALNGKEFGLGRARSAGYGRVRLCIDEDMNEDDGAAIGRASDGAGPTCRLRLSFASDALLRGPAAAPVTDLSSLLEACAELLSKDASDIFDVPKCKAQLRTRRIESWQSAWGLPRPTLVAIQAGSIVEIQLKESATRDELIRALRDGIGERRAEGYGVVEVDHPLTLGTSVQVTEVKRGQATCDTEATAPLSEAERTFLGQVERRSFSRQILAAAEAAAYSEFNAPEAQRHLNWNVSDEHPRMSQIGALRAVLGGPRDIDALERARLWVGKLEKHSGKNDDRALPPWPEKSMKGLKRLLSEPKSSEAACIWKVLRMRPPQEDEPAVRARAIVIYLLTCMRTYKRALEDRRGGVKSEPQEVQS